MTVSFRIYAAFWRALIGPKPSYCTIARNRHLQRTMLFLWAPRLQRRFQREMRSSRRRVMTIFHFMGFLPGPARIYLQCNHQVPSISSLRGEKNVWNTWARGGESTRRCSGWKRNPHEFFCIFFFSLKCAKNGPGTWRKTPPDPPYAGWGSFSTVAAALVLGTPHIVKFKIRIFGCWCSSLTKK